MFIWEEREYVLDMWVIYVEGRSCVYALHTSSCCHLSQGLCLRGRLQPLAFHGLLAARTKESESPRRLLMNACLPTMM